MFINGKYVPDSCSGCICVHCEKKWNHECEQEDSCEHIATTDCLLYEKLTHETFMMLTAMALMRGIDLDSEPIVYKPTFN
jgi:hypothetical protein